MGDGSRHFPTEAILAEMRDAWSNYLGTTKQEQRTSGGGFAIDAQLIASCITTHGTQIWTIDAPLAEWR